MVVVEEKSKKKNKKKTECVIDVDSGAVSGGTVNVDMGSTIEKNTKKKKDKSKKIMLENDGMEEASERVTKKDKKTKKWEDTSTGKAGDVKGDEDGNEQKKKNEGKKKKKGKDEAALGVNLEDMEADQSEKDGSLPEVAEGFDNGAVSEGTVNVDMGSTIEKNTKKKKKDKSKKRILEIDEMEEASERVRKKDKKTKKWEDTLIGKASDVKGDEDGNEQKKKGEGKKKKKGKNEGALGVNLQDMETDQSEKDGSLPEVAEGFDFDASERKEKQKKNHVVNDLEEIHQENEDDKKTEKRKKKKKTEQLLNDESARREHEMENSAIMKKKKTETVEKSPEGTDQKEDDGMKTRMKKSKSVDVLQGTESELDTDLERTYHEAEDRRSKKKTKTKSDKNEVEGTVNETEDGNKKKRNKTGMEQNDSKGADHEAEDGNKKKRKKTEKDKNDVEGSGHETEDNVEKRSKAKKRVSFSSNVEVFPSSGDKKKAKRNNPPHGELGLGKRFSAEEDAILEQAIQEYIDVHNLGAVGREMIGDLKKNPQLKGCWQEIGMALPWRAHKSIYSRGRALLGRGDSFKTWTPEDREKVLKFYEERGPQWKELADQLGKYRYHVKDAYRRYKLPDVKKGSWSQDEYQKLFDLVNKDLQLKASEEKKSKYGMLRDNICWGAISDKLGTRILTTCCLKWYKQLSSPMVAEGIWSDTDDYHLLDALYNLDACCMEDVEWDNLLEHRSGEICRKRWNQMVRHIGEHKHQTFAEQVEVLSQRYCPNLIEAREAYDNKPYVDKVSPVK